MLGRASGKLSLEKEVQMFSRTVMGVPIHVYYANKENLDEVQKAKLEDPTHGFGKPADAETTNNGNVSTHGPIYQPSPDAMFNSFENARVSPFRKI